MTANRAAKNDCARDDVGVAGMERGGRSRQMTHTQRTFMFATSAKNDMTSVTPSDATHELTSNFSITPLKRYFQIAFKGVGTKAPFNGGFAFG